MNYKNYTVCSSENLRLLCIKNDWFTEGSNNQYDKLFRANAELAPIEEIATIIWVCSDEEKHSRRDILEKLKQTRKEYIETFLSTEGDSVSEADERDERSEVAIQLEKALKIIIDKTIGDNEPIAEAKYNLLKELGITNAKLKELGIDINKL